MINTLCSFLLCVHHWNFNCFYINSQKSCWSYTVLTAEAGYGEMRAGGKQHGAQLGARESCSILKVE